MISTKLKKMDFDLLFPDATVVISKKKAGTIHYVVFVKRPTKLSLELKFNDNKHVILICPSNFYRRVIEKSPYWNLFLEIVLLSNIEYDPNKNIEFIRLYLFSHYIKITEKSIPKTVNGIKETINYMSVLKNISSEQLLISLINIAQKNYIPNFKFKKYYSGDIDVLGLIPDRIKSLINKKSISKKNYLELLLDIVEANTVVEVQEGIIFFYISDNLSYQELISTLLEHRNDDFSFLVEKCNFIISIDRSSNKILFRLVEVKKYKGEILQALQNINEFLKSNFSKSIISPQKGELARLKQKQEMETGYFKNIGGETFKSFLSFLRTEEYSDYNLIIFYCNIINSFIRKHIKISEDDFLNYLYINWLADVKIQNRQIKNYQSYSKGINSYVDNTKIKHKFFSIYNSTNKKEIYFSKLSTLVKENITKQTETDNYSLQFNNELHLIDEVGLKDNSRYTYLLLKKNLDKVADCIGLNMDMKILCTYTLLNKETSK